MTKKIKALLYETYSVLRVQKIYDRITEFKLLLCILSLSIALSIYAPVTIPLLLALVIISYLSSALLLPALLALSLTFSITYPFTRDYQAVIFFGIFLISLTQLLNEWNNIVLNYQIRKLGFLLSTKYPNLKVKEQGRWTYCLSKTSSTPYTFNIVCGHEKSEKITWSTPINSFLQNNKSNLLWIYGYTNVPRQLDTPETVTFFGAANSVHNFIIQHWDALIKEELWRREIESYLDKEKITYHLVDSILVVNNTDYIYATTWEMLPFINVEKLKNSFPNLTIWLEGNQTQWEDEGILFISASPAYLVHCLTHPQTKQIKTSYEQSGADAWAYKELELTRNATPEEIKRRFQKLVKKYHPDKNKNKESTARYQSIIAAYHHLKNKAN